MPIATLTPQLPDLICVSHLRWNFVFQRPQHLLTRCANERRVYYVEEPIFENRTSATIELEKNGQVYVAVPKLPHGLTATQTIDAQRRLLDVLISEQRMTRYVLWYYTPMAVPFTAHLTPEAVVYDCMDELSAFKNAPPSLKAYESMLLERASVVFTGGQSLYEAKRHCHPNVQAFPSSVDVNHFARARHITAEPADQAAIGHPRLGFFGVLDERLDLELLAGIAAARPHWQFVLIGPVVKIDPQSLPSAANIHYLGAKRYEELPQYLAGWDVALLLFARNEATRYISPTKTPEYLAAGRPVVSTSIRDVVRPYGEQGLARIADSVPEFITACEAALVEDSSPRLRKADVFLRRTSWVGTWAKMRRQLDLALDTTAELPLETTGSATTAQAL